MTDIRPATIADLRAIDAMRRSEQEAVGFIPFTRYEHQILRDPDCLLTCWDNDDLTGLLYWTRGLPVATIIQLVIRSDARRRERGLTLVKAAIELMQRAAGRYGVTCRCRRDLEAVEFWAAVGFEIVRLEPGGRRGDCIRFFHQVKDSLIPLAPHLPFRRRIWGARREMEIDWMTRDELSQAIPPCYSRYLAQFVPTPNPHDAS